MGRTPILSGSGFLQPDPTGSTPYNHAFHVFMSAKLPSATRAGMCNMPTVQQEAQSHERNTSNMPHQVQHKPYKGATERPCHGMRWILLSL